MKLTNSLLMVIRQLDTKMKIFQSLSSAVVPSASWIGTIRKTLNMSLKQAGQRLKMSPQGVKDLENREADGSISLKSLREAGRALDLKLVYGFIPFDGSLEEMIEKRAREIATTIIKRTAVTMSLEDQSNSNERLKQSVDDMTQDIKREVPKSLWD